MNEDPILWLLGEYVVYIERDVELNQRKISNEDLVGYLEARHMACNYLKIPPIGYIPGMNLL